MKIKLLLVIFLSSYLPYSQAYDLNDLIFDSTKRVVIDFTTSAAIKAALKARLEADEKEKEEEIRKAAAEEELKKREMFLKEEEKKIAKQEKLRLQRLKEAETLKFQAKALVDKSSSLKVKLQSKENQLNELKLQLEAEKQQLKLEKKAHIKASIALQEEKNLISMQKIAIENKAFLYSMGFWSSLGAIALGLLGIIMRVPTIRLEREKLRKEILHLERQLSHCHNGIVNDGREAKNTYAVSVETPSL